MIDIELTKIFSLFRAVKYKKERDYSEDYRRIMRPCHNIAFVIEGEGKIETENEALTVKAGEILFIPKGTTYFSTWKGNPSVIYHTIHFNFSTHYDPLFNFETPIQILNCRDFKEAHGIFEGIYELGEKKESAFLLLSLFFSLCDDLFTALKTTPKNENKNPILPALNYLNENTSALVTIEELSAMCFMSPSRFHFLFKKYTGLAPIAYKNHILIQKAAQELMLEKDKSIEELSTEYGFESVIYFRRVFKRITGKTPSEYRRENSLL